jgi:hypothetical protein
MSTKSIYYDTFCRPDDPANISVYESNGAYCMKMSEGLIYINLLFTGSTADEFTTKVFTESDSFKQHITTASRPQLRIV